VKEKHTGLSGMPDVNSMGVQNAPALKASR